MRPDADHPLMPIKATPHFVGRAWITPDDPVVAGQLGTWTVTYEVGAYGYDERARLKIAWRFASDWGTPQFKDPHGRNYTTVRLETACATAVADLAVEPRGQVRPWFKTLVVAVADGSLSPGDRIHVTIGDTSGGGAGSRAQTFREKDCEWRIFVDPFGTELYTALAASPASTWSAARSTGSSPSHRPRCAPASRSTRSSRPRTCGAIRASASTVSWRWTRPARRSKACRAACAGRAASSPSRA